jgi:YHS domain-containing protein
MTKRNMTMKSTNLVTKDPVCGMTVDGATAIYAERDSKTYYFCRDGCRHKLLATPVGTKPAAKSGCCCGSGIGCKQAAAGPPLKSVHA